MGFLSHPVSSEGVAVELSKVAAMRERPIPMAIFNVDLRSSIGHCNYYQCFVDGYPDVAGPLICPCGPHVPRAWGPTEGWSIETLKMCLGSALVLRTFDSRRRSVLTISASKVTILAVLKQPDDEGSTTR